jgi:hypothetical protein
MPKHARVAILMAAMIIFAVAMLDLVRSKVEASGHVFKAAAVQYTTLRRIYAVSSSVVPAASEASDKIPGQTR